MVPATLAFLHAVHIYSQPSARVFNHLTVMKAAEPKLAWSDIVKARAKHHEIKLRLAEVAKHQKKANSLYEYMSYEKEFLSLIERDDKMRAAMSRMIMRYLSKKHKK